MTLDNLITLISAGFTKEEILTMSGTATQRAPQPAGRSPAGAGTTVPTGAGGRGRAVGAGASTAVGAGGAAATATATDPLTVLSTGLRRISESTELYAGICTAESTGVSTGVRTAG